MFGDHDARLSLTELNRTRPDYVAFVPSNLEREGLNEHFIVFEGPDDSLMAVWTQSDLASGLPGGRQKNRIMFSRSDDAGKTWAPPARIVGPENSEDDSCRMASWAFPMVTDRGRIYVVYSQHMGKVGWCAMHTGLMYGLYSDDAGETWSEPEEAPFERNRHDDPDGDLPPEWIVWQRPMKDLQGNFLAPYSRWVNKKVAALSPETIKAHNAGWTWWESVCEVMRFVNLHDHPAVRDIAITYSAWGDRALRVPHYLFPECSVAQEPSIVRLPDDRIFCVMRTNSGYLWHSVSRDDGETWSNPAPLLYRDHGLPILNPVGCAPIYRMIDGRYALFFSNNRGNIDRDAPCECRPRNPTFLSIGEFRPGCDQPLQFSEPVKFMDSDFTNVFGQREGNTDLSLYSSFTTGTGKNILWYPDRKCCLFGKEVRPGS